MCFTCVVQAQSEIGFKGGITISNLTKDLNSFYFDRKNGYEFGVELLLSLSQKSIAMKYR